MNCQNSPPWHVEDGKLSKDNSLTKGHKHLQMKNYHYANVATLSIACLSCCWLMCIFTLITHVAFNNNISIDISHHGHAL